ncbi:hypothetical protein BKA83DRAFT_112210, partial [Pisolithus microcarpus]
VVLSKGQSKIDVVISRTSTALSPIFQFHSTAVMNFVSADTIFCSYPELMLRRLSMVNAGPLYCSPDRRGVLDAVRKYQTRGIQYIRCQDFHGLKNTCKWILGGMPCGLESAFCHPRMEVIEEES